MLSAGKVTCPYVSVILIQLICKIASLHAPKVLQFLHRFQNCFCFRSILFVMHQKCGNLVFSMQTLAHQPPLLHFQLCHHRHLVSNQLVQLGNICLLQFLLLPVIVIVHLRQGMFSPWLVVWNQTRPAQFRRLSWGICFCLSASQCISQPLVFVTSSLYLKKWARYWRWIANLI